jgi:hypothetical protein
MLLLALGTDQTPLFILSSNLLASSMPRVSLGFDVVSIMAFSLIFIGEKLTIEGAKNHIASNRFWFKLGSQ